MKVSFEPDPEVSIAGVEGRVIVLRVDGLPILTVDDAGNVGITGRLRTEDSVTNRASRSAEYRRPAAASASLR